QPRGLGERQIAHARHLDLLKRCQPASPRIAAGHVPLVIGVVERSLEHRQHSIGTGAALANFLGGGWLGAELRLVALGAALGRAVRHVVQPGAQLLRGQLAHHQITQRGEDVHPAATDEIADRLALLVLVVNVALHRLPHGEADDRAVAIASRAGDHRMGLGLGLLEAEHVSAIGAGSVVGTPQGLHAVLAVADVAAQQPAPYGVALPALPAEVHLALHQRLPMRLPPALAPGARRRSLQTCVLDGAAHPSSLFRSPFTVWRATKHGPKIGVSASVCRRCGRYQYIEKQGFCKLPPFAAVYLARSLTAKTGVRVPLGSAMRDFFSFASMCLPICPGEFATFLFSSCFAIAAAFSRSCSAARLYLSTSLSVLWPVTAMISCALHPASARRRAAAFRRP